MGQVGVFGESKSFPNFVIEIRIRWTRCNSRKKTRLIKFINLNEVYSGLKRVQDLCRR